MRAFEKTLSAIQSGIDARLQIGAQVFVARGCEVLLDEALGESRAGVKMTTDTVMLWLSAGKPVGAVAIAMLWERGLLDLDDRITRFIPEFGASGKEAITIRHILTHTAGFRGGDTGWPDLAWDQTIARTCALRQERDWIPGKKAGYHITTSWFVLGELVRRLDGRPFERFVREEIFLPLGMDDSWFALTSEEYHRLGDRLGIMPRTEGNQIAPQPAPWDTEAGCTHCRPAGSAHGPIRQLGRFYQMILLRGELDGVRIIRPQTAEALVARHRVGMFDQTFRHVMDWGLGFMINTAYTGDALLPYHYGPHAGMRTFGHGGNQSSAGFADPENNLAVAVVFNGTPGEAAHDVRLRGFCAALYDDLALGG